MLGLQNCYLLLHRDWILPCVLPFQLPSHQKSPFQPRFSFPSWVSAPELGSTWSFLSRLLHCPVLLQHWSHVWALSNGNRPVGLHVTDLSYPPLTRKSSLVRLVTRDGFCSSRMAQSWFSRKNFHSVSPSQAPKQNHKNMRTEKTSKQASGQLVEIIWDQSLCDMSDHETHRLQIQNS